MDSVEASDPARAFVGQRFSAALRRGPMQRHGHVVQRALIV
jgi:hypothetical protein